jgi:hypothetical protein
MAGIVAFLLHRTTHNRVVKYLTEFFLMSILLIDKTRVATSSQAVYFRDASHRGLIVIGTLFALIGLYVAFPKGAEVNYFAAFIPALPACLFFFLAAWRLYAGRGSNWMLAIDNNEVYVNVGYSAGYSMQQKEYPVLSVPRELIDRVGPVRETLRLPNRLGATRYHLGYVDIRLKHPVSEEILCVCREANDTCAGFGKSGPFSLRFMSPRLLRMNWSAMIPTESVALHHFGRYIEVAQGKEVKFPDWDALDAAQQDVYLDELWSMGMRDEALFLARIHLKVSSAMAKAIMQERAAEYRERWGR